MNWIITRIKWVFWAGLIGGPIFAFLSYQDVQRLSTLETSGVEAEAFIEGATKKTGRRSGTSYKLDLKWQDETGQVRTKTDVEISSAFATTLIRNDQIIADTLPIIYMQDDPSVEPVAKANLASLKSNKQGGMQFGLIGFGVGLLGTVAMFLLGRRKKDTPA